MDPNELLTPSVLVPVAALLTGPGSTPPSAPKPDAFDDVTPFEQLLRGQ